MSCHISKYTFFSLSSSIRSGLLAAVVYHKLNSKSHNNLARASSKTCPLVHLSLYHFTSFFTRWYSFTHATAITISTLLCLVKYSLFAMFLHPPSRCSTVSFCSLHCLIYHLRLALLLLSTILFATFVPALTLFKLSFQVLSFVLTIDCTAGFASYKLRYAFFLVVNFSSSFLNLFL